LVETASGKLQGPHVPLNAAFSVHLGSGASRVMGARPFREHRPGTLGESRVTSHGVRRRLRWAGRAAHVLLLKCFDDCGASYGEVREGQSTGTPYAVGIHDWVRRPATHSGGSFAGSVSCLDVAPAGSGRRSHAGIFQPAWERAPEIQSICSRLKRPRERPVNPAGKCHAFRRELCRQRQLP